LGISFDDIEANAAFAEKYAFPYRLLCDTAREVGTAYHAVRESGNAKRISYLIDPNGTIAKAWSTVTPKTHPEEVLAAIDS
jgi:peroxiredoxin Q/BCP